MNRPKQKQVTVSDLVEEAKKRIVILAICVVGLSYLMSLTSSSVLVNLPAAASLIILLRYYSLDYEMRRKADAYNSQSASTNALTPKQPPEFPKVVEHCDWRRKVNSPVVENAIDQFTRHLISEWMTDLWYSRLTPDKEGPEELVQIINGVLGEFSERLRNINLINLLTRDLINLFCSHLELFQNKLHPALFSTEAEHKVLQHLMNGLISFTFRPKDLQCSFFRYTVRELLACAVIRPVINLVNPRFINERIESAVISKKKAKGELNAAQDASKFKPNGSSKIPSDHFSKSLDPSVTGVELVQLKTNQFGVAGNTAATDNLNGTQLSKDPLLSMDTRTSRSWSSVPMNSQTGAERGIEKNRSGGEWGDMLDLISRRKTEALAPENFENIWTKGRNYKKDGEKRLIEQVPRHYSAGNPAAVEHAKAVSKTREKYPAKLNSSESHVSQPSLIDQSKIEKSFPHEVQNVSYCSSVVSSQEDDHDLVDLVEVESESSDLVGHIVKKAGGRHVQYRRLTKTPSSRKRSRSTRQKLPVWQEVERTSFLSGEKAGGRHVQYRRLTKTPSSRKRSRSTRQKLPVWQEVERTSFLSGDGQDILNSLNGHGKAEYSSDDSETEFFGRLHSGATASSLSIAESRSLTTNSLQNSLAGDVIHNNSSWSIKRRFRHFEELHQRLKSFPEYKLHLPPKHFLSSGLDIPVIRERCKLLDEYLKMLLQLPSISGSIEVWDFLSVDSQTYVFSSSFSIVETLSVGLDDNPSEKSKTASNVMGPLMVPLTSGGQQLDTESNEPSLQIKPNFATDGLRNAKNVLTSSKLPTEARCKSSEDTGSDSDTRVGNTLLVRNSKENVRGRENKIVEDTSELLLDSATYPTIPTEWVPPNLTAPILDLVDVIFQLQDGGWVRRKAFWVAKQILQLGMGDAFDDWLIEKIQLLRKGSVVASGIKRVEQILWPDGIFITKHPRRQRPPPPSSPSQASTRPQSPETSSPISSDEQKQLEAERRAKFVYELMIDEAPAAIVGLFGHKEYEQCAKDLYFFIQSSVCLKLLAYDVIELLLLSAIPEMDYVFKQLHDEKHKFGDYKAN
ncbi:hypothetical protein F3Y22_tig00113124pilonHSYRG00585 [Hibiscus syriacus]|uniref:Uncharacterized protein n=1 Tax=Hibiscus syriacus TaxID=106335 RepID=A0A6A2X318_HIBSY|nr:hypothetical protein F3Y22_tig00113124pilonHSYRG00585 [Hibiscus syriacus]